TGVQTVLFRSPLRSGAWPRAGPGRRACRAIAPPGSSRIGPSYPVSSPRLGDHQLTPIGFSKYVGHCFSRPLFEVHIGAGPQAHDYVSIADLAFERFGALLVTTVY